MTRLIPLVLLALTFSVPRRVVGHQIRGILVSYIFLLQRACHIQAFKYEIVIWSQSGINEGEGGVQYVNIEEAASLEK